MQCGLAILCLALLVSLCVAQTDLPSCYSSTDQYIHKQFIVPVQPQEPILVQRFQGPQIRIFCISFEEAGPSCGGNAVPQLCYRRVDDPSADFFCEALNDYSSDANAKITRGSINGADNIWLLKWDGTGKNPSCFPRSVETRVMAFVRGKEVESLAVFIILLIVAILAFVLMVIAFGLFLRERYAKIDEAGATTIGGPRSTFQGPQLNVAQGAVVKDQTKVYLPVRDENAAMSDMTSSKFGNMSQTQLQRGPANVSTRGPNRARRASPPAPGDGVEDEALRSRIDRQRRRGVMDDDAVGDEFYGSGSDYFTDDEGRRRHRRRGSRPDEMSTKTPQRGALFPTQENWDAEPSAFFDEEDAYQGNRSAIMPVSGGISNQQTVKYVPQWMQGSFGKGGSIPEIGDGEEVERVILKDGNYVVNNSANRTPRGPGSGNAKQFGMYNKTRRSPNRSGMPTEDKENSAFGQTPRSALKRRNVRNNGASPNDGNYSDRGARDDDAIRRGVNFDENGNPRSFAARRRRNMEGASPEGDNFRRENASLHGANPNWSLQATSPGGATPRGGATSLNPAGDQIAQQPTQLRCHACKIPLGTGNDPVYCRVTGELHN